MEVLLLNERRERNQATEGIAAMISLDADAIQAIERGERKIDGEEPPKVADWARNLGVDRDILDRTLRKSLGTPVGAGFYSGNRPVRLTTEQEQFVQRVLQAFDERKGPQETE